MKAKISIAAYLEMEERSEFKYEFHDGEVYAMAGGSIAHGEISSNAHNFLKNKFRSKGGKCRAFNSDIKVFIKDVNTFVYPDASAVCGKIEEHENGQGYHNPTLIIEVLSDSTESYDRSGKFRKYRKLPSLLRIYFNQPIKTRDRNFLQT